jgi:hypothetical protein
MSDTPTSDTPVAPPNRRWSELFTAVLAEERTSDPTPEQLADARRTFQTDARAARQLIASVSEIAASTDPMAGAMAGVLRTFLFAMLQEQIEELMEMDEGFARHCGELMLRALDVSAEEPTP